MAYSSHSLFCDETGSTGSRFLDPAQPFYAEGGWFISHEHRPAAMEAILQIEKKYNFGAAELKGKDLAKKPRGQALMQEVCATVGKNGGIPFIYAVEKKYAVCSKIVETFFDPMYNHQIASADTWNPKKRQEEAQFFYDNGGHLIEEFAEAYRLKDSLAVKQNAENWISKFTTSGHKQQAEKIRGVLTELEDEIRTEAKHDASGTFPSGMDSLNLPTIVCVFQFVEQHCPYQCDIVHDQNASFEPLYRHIFDLYAKAKPGILRMKDGRETHFGFKNALSLLFADSKKQPLIRAADYALTGARKFVQLALADEPIPSDITFIAFGNLGALLMAAYSHIYPSLEPMPELASVMASNQWSSKVFGRLSVELKQIIPST